MLMDTNGNTKELIKDLCSRLPYGVKVLVDNKHWIDFDGRTPSKLTFDNSYRLLYVGTDLGYVKPYLFPLSSMTEEQQEEFDRIYADDMQVVACNLKNKLDGKPYETNFGHYRHIDWLNANHFDYRGLIEKGLAIDATGLNIY